MRRCRRRGAAVRGALLLGAIAVLAASGPAQAQPVTPTVLYPPNGATNIKWNPTVFWTPYSRPGAGFEQEVQLDFQIQISATAGSFASGDIVYETDNGGTQANACAASSPPRCHGAGMAHYVGADGSYPGLFRNALAGQTRLAPGTLYHLRMRVMGEDGIWSAWTPAVSFTTVAYGGITFHVDPAGTDSPTCGDAATPCASPGFVLNQRVVSGRGDIVSIRPGRYLLPQADSESGGSTNRDIDFVGGSGFPDRVWIRGTDPANRPVLQADTNPPDGAGAVWIKTNGMQDVIWENLMVEGHPDCCTSTCGSSSSSGCFRQPGDTNTAVDIHLWIMFQTDGESQRSLRNSWIGVEFRRNFAFRGNFNTGQVGDEDQLFHNVVFQGEPEYAFVGFYNDENRNPDMLAQNNSRFVTLKNVYMDSGANVLFFDGDRTRALATQDILVEDTRIDRRSLHVFRPDRRNARYTVRRLTLGDGEEGLSFLGNGTSIKNIVVENCTFYGQGLQLGEPGGDGPIDYVVVQNNILVNNGSLGDSSGWGLHTCDVSCLPSIITCSGANCVFRDASTRIQIDYNGYGSAAGSSTTPLVRWLPFDTCSANPQDCYSRRGNAGKSVEWDNWLAAEGAAYDQNSPFQLYSGTKREPPDPRFVTQPPVSSIGDGTVTRGDFRLQAGSPMVDAGHPSYRVPAGGGARVDIGAYERTAAAPTFTLTVIPEGTGSGTVTSSPAGIQCGSDCVAGFAENTTVVLSASPAIGSVFAGWNGDPDCADGVVNMTADRQCRPNFALASFALTVGIAGGTGGSVSSNPPGITCPGDCTEAYAAGTVVALVPVAAPGESFVRWTGDPDCADGSVTMNGDRSCTAEFSGPIACDEASVVGAVAAASAAGGGVVRFACRDTTIFMSQGLGTLADNVVVDGESRNITLEYTRDFTGCLPGNNGIGGPPVARMTGSGNVIRGLTFRNYLESLQISGPGNTVEDNQFFAHPCSDDAVSVITVGALNNLVQRNQMFDYADKAFQLNQGGAVIHQNTFIDCDQPLRGDQDNSAGGVFEMTENVMRTSDGDRARCTGPRFDGTYLMRFERNTVECLRGLRVAGQTKIVIRDNFVEGNPRHGILLYGSAVATLSGNRVLNNGAVPGSQPAGGVVVSESAQADLGGGSLTVGGQVYVSAGNNILQGNGVADARNLRAGYTLKAENNCWDGTSVAEILLDVEGDVDFEPFSLACGAGPQISAVSPRDGETCVADGSDIEILVTDSPEGVDAASVTVQLNGQPAVPTITGSSSALTVRVPLPGALPADGAVTVSVSAADLARPANPSSVSYSFRVQPAPPTGVQVP